MYRRSSFILTVAALFIMGTAGSASAAQVSQISWDVVGGNINADFFGGAITGGTVVWTAPTASGISTPSSHIAGTGTLQIDLYTAYNSLHAVGLGVTGLGVNAGSMFASFVLGSGSVLTSGSLPMYNFSGFMQYVAAAGYGSGSGTTFSGSSLYAHFVLGNEVRTIVDDPGGEGPPGSEVPEPTAALAFGFGLSVVAWRCVSRRKSA